MKTKWLAIAILPAVAAPGRGRRKERLQRLKTPRWLLTRVSRREVDAEESFDCESWKQKLTAGDLEERERAFDRLAETARRAATHARALEEWSKGGDAELRWTSRLLLRELQRTPHAFRFGVPRWSQAEGGDDATGWGALASTSTTSRVASRPRFDVRRPALAVGACSDRSPLRRGRRAAPSR